MEGKFYKVDYVPNKLVYVYKRDKNNIYFLAFINKEAVKHSVSRKHWRDLKKVPSGYKPIESVFNMINLAIRQFNNLTI